MLKEYLKKCIPLTNMLYGTLIKITNTKKLMIKIEQDAHKFISTKLTSYAALKKIKMDRPATFCLTNDDEISYFVSISLDKYDKALLDTKFEPLLKKQVSITYKFKCYSFTPEGEEIVKSGINVELVSIRKITPRVDVVDKIADEAARAAIDPPSPMNALERQVNAMILPDVLPVGRPELKRS